MIKINEFFLFVCFCLGIMYLNTEIAKAAEKLSTGPKQNNLVVSAVVDEYLAVYKSSSGVLRAETNTENKFFYDSSICIINY